MTAFAYTVVLPDDQRDEDVILAYFAAADQQPHDNVRTLFDAFAPAWTEATGRPAPTRWSDLLDDADLRAEAVETFRAFAASSDLVDLTSIPVLVWSTDDNPARKIQCQLFRTWHLRTYGEPVDILPDPANRQITKTIVQSLANAGPDLIESYGPAQVRQFVASGMALDVSEFAAERGFGLDRVFPVAHDSMAVDGRQYAFPCNLGYTVMFYHRDMFREAGIPEPTEPWTYDDLVANSRRIIDHYRETHNQRRFGVMGLDAWGMPLVEGTRFYNPEATASFYNTPETVRILKRFQDLMYVDQVMPTRAEAASAASSGGATMNADAESASASSLFKNKVTAIVRDGRWAYKGWAEINRDRAYLPAIERRLAALGDSANPTARTEIAALTEARDTLQREVLDPMSEEAYAALAACLSDTDRARMLDVGVMHVPSFTGVPWYEVGARVAIVNRTSAHRELGVHFLEFLASREYNEQINQTFDSICGVPAYCLDENGISGPPRPLPGLEAFDSPVFAEAMEYAEPAQMSPFIGDNIKGILVAPWIERLTNNVIGPAETARRIEDTINERMAANIS
ncbi:MAG: extracellular solute-binding protein, partial [Phycisphaerales bacterium]|nr:extracellular solute-binding protein [Phycisphaerales bacterium]